MRLLTLFLAAVLVAGSAVSAASEAATPSGLERTLPAGGRFGFLSLVNNPGAGRSANYISLPGRPVSGGLVTVWSVDVFARPRLLEGVPVAFSAALNLVDCARRRVSIRRALIYGTQGQLLLQSDRTSPWQSEASADAELTRALDAACGRSRLPTVSGVAAMRQDATRRLGGR